MRWSWTRWSLLISACTPLAAVPASRQHPPLAPPPAPRCACRVSRQNIVHTWRRSNLATTMRTHRGYRHTHQQGCRCARMQACMHVRRLPCRRPYTRQARASRQGQASQERQARTAVRQAHTHERGRPGRWAERGRKRLHPTAPLPIWVCHLSLSQMRARLRANPAPVRARQQGSKTAHQHGSMSSVTWRGQFSGRCSCPPLSARGVGTALMAMRI